METRTVLLLRFKEEKIKYAKAHEHLTSYLDSFEQGKGLPSPNKFIKAVQELENVLDNCVMILEELTKLPK
jgi:hypothetical protein